MERGKGRGRGRLCVRRTGMAIVADHVELVMTI